jgi:hypothetical protein
VDRVQERLILFDHDVEVSAFLLFMTACPCSIAGAPLPLVGLVRDGRATVRSGMSNGWYWNPLLEPLSWTTLMPTFDGDRFEQCCQYWSWACGRLESWATRIVTLEGLRSDQDERRRLLSIFDGRGDDPPFPHENATEFDARPCEDGSWSAAFPPHTQWSRWERDAFRFYCSDFMDRFYPAWREDTGGPA